MTIIYKDWKGLKKGKRFFVYFLRWQLSTLVMFVPLSIILFLGSKNYYLNLVICQTVCSVIMYPVDRHIFKGGHKYKKLGRINKPFINKGK